MLMGLERGWHNVKILKALLFKSANAALALMAVVAVVFANCQCIGRAYEPELPEELK